MHAVLYTSLRIANVLVTKYVQFMRALFSQLKKKNRSNISEISKRSKTKQVEMTSARNEKVIRKPQVQNHRHHPISTRLLTILNFSFQFIIFFLQVNSGTSNLNPVSTEINLAFTQFPLWHVRVQKTIYV